MLPKTFFVTSLLITPVIAMPPNDKNFFNDGPEARIRKRPRPCRGRSANEGRTFFDWSVQYADINYNHNYNYNYNVNCGGGGGGGGQHGGGGNYGGNGGGPQKPILSALLQGIGNQLADSGGLFGDNGPVNFVQQQVQGIVSNVGSLGSLIPEDGIFGGQGLGSLFQGGLFNGQGISSLFDNGLFNGIFDNRPSGGNPPSNTPSRPIITTTTPKPTGGDPDDIIYNDEKPVHENHDPVFPDNYNRPAPLYYYNRRRPNQYSRSNRIRFS